MPERVCLTCDQAIPGIRRRSAYCSDRCRYKRRDLLRALPCTICGEPTGLTSTTRQEAMHPRCKPWEHGTRHGYREHGCRCFECREWNRLSHQDFRQKRRDEGRPVRQFGGSGPWISPSVRLAVYERDDWTCQLCKEPVDSGAGPQSDWYPSLDHVVPQSKGGAHDAANLRTAHRWCNSIRGAEDYHADLIA